MEMLINVLHISPESVFAYSHSSTWQTQAKSSKNIFDGKWKIKLTLHLGYANRQESHWEIGTYAAEKTFRKGAALKSQ